MRQRISFLGLAWVMAIAVGCNHVGGRCDCVQDNVPGTCGYYKVGQTVSNPQPVSQAAPIAPAESAPMPKEAPKAK